jgi:hypothetical protein
MSNVMSDPNLMNIKMMERQRQMKKLDAMKLINDNEMFK